MKKIDLGQMLTLLANFGVIVGLLLLVYELNQARDFAKIEFVNSNRLAFQEVEMNMIDPDIAAVWVKGAVDPDSMSKSEIRVMDAFLINLYNHWQQQWFLEQEGFLKSGASEAALMTDVPFYFGSTFAQVWWEDLKTAHDQPGALEFDALIDKALADTDPSANRQYLERIQQRVRERVSVGEE